MPTVICSTQLYQSYSSLFGSARKEYQIFPTITFRFITMGKSALATNASAMELMMTKAFRRVVTKNFKLRS